MLDCRGCGQQLPAAANTRACVCGAVDITLRSIPPRPMTAEELEHWTQTLGVDVFPIGRGRSTRVIAECPECGRQTHVRRSPDEVLRCPYCRSTVKVLGGRDGAVL